MSVKLVLVAACALIDADGRVLIAQRPQGKSMAGLWEFPGGKIESGEYCRGDILPAADLAHEYNVSIRVTYCALAMLAANRYVSRPGAFTSYTITWQEGT